MSYCLKCAAHPVESMLLGVLLQQLCQAAAVQGFV
jgi:hypothetical protein